MVAYTVHPTEINSKNAGRLRVKTNEPRDASPNDPRACFVYTLRQHYNNITLILG